MIMKACRFGNPLSSGAVIEKPTKFLSKFDASGIRQSKNSTSISFSYRLSNNDVVFGLGEQMGGINKRGRKYITYNTDVTEHTPEKLSLYGSHPFLIVHGKKDWGIFLDYPGEILFDLGFSHKDLLMITVQSHDFDLFYWCDLTWQEIVTEYITLTGGVYIPPKWAFGYQQSRWSYPDADSVREIADKFRQLGIPCDAIYLDIDYMQDYKVFSINKERFPKFSEFVKELKDKGFHLVPIIDPGVKIEPEYKVFDEGFKNKYFCTDEAGEFYKAAVWPGLTHLPDFSAKAVRTWWGGLYDQLITQGIEGFWNDMNEPSIFFSEPRSKVIYEKLHQAAKSDKLIELDLSSLRGELTRLHNSRDDYKAIYQHPEKNCRICHDNIHNLYGAQMTLAFSDHVQEKYPEKRFLIFSRSSYSGSQRYAGIWYGDNKSWWQHLEMNIKMLINCNLGGYFYSGADIGGFGDNCRSELLVRWLQLGVFSPLFRNHSAIYTRNQEPWAFDDDTLINSRNIIRLRYAFMPWLYSQFLEFAGMNIPLIRSLYWDYNTLRALQTEDQFCFGESCLIAPVYKPNSTGRFVYLPEDRWLIWKARTWEERNLEIIEAGDHYLNCPLDRQLIFFRENSLFALQEPEDFVDQRKPDTLIIIGLVTRQAQLKLMVDSGKYPAFSGMSVLEISVNFIDNCFEIETHTIKKETLPWKHLVFELYDTEGKLAISHRKI
jgi:alpha-glucosidase